MVDLSVFKLKHGWGYKGFGIYQEYDPDEAGFVPMTEGRARYLSDTLFAKQKESEREYNIAKMEASAK